MTRAKQEKATVTTRMHSDGATSHKVDFANGDSHLFLFPHDHALAQQFRAQGERAKILAAINSVDTTEKAVKKVHDLSEAFDEGKWSLQGEADPSAKAGGLARAIAEIKGISLEDATQIVSGLSRANQAKLRGTERVAALLAKYKDSNEGDALLDGILGGNEAAAEEAAA